MNKFYVTTPIYYINDIPHIGHAYTTVAADVVARYYKNKIGEENVLFLTGTDEHGVKVAKAAKEKGLDPKKYADSIVTKFIEAWKLLNIEYSHFFRTTDEKHEERIQEIMQKIYNEDYFYEDTYEGFYCEGCEKFLIGSNDIVNGKCPLHPNITPVKQKEKNYFFRLSDFRANLIYWFEQNVVKIEPESKRNEIVGKLKAERLKDIAISREEVKWGIPIPWDNKQTIYVWVEALFNYYTATKFLKGKKRFWPTNVHFIGKDILWFHTVIWCSLLKAANLPLPEKVFAHGFFTINGEKISKSLGNVISPKELVNKYGTDATRYLLLSQFPFGGDGDFSFDKLTKTYNAHLANGLGNLVARTAKLCEKVNIDVKIPQRVTNENIENYKFFEAIENIQKNIKELDGKIDKREPWKIKDNSKIKIFLEEIINGILNINNQIKPFMPEAAEKIERQFSQSKIEPQKPLFPRI